MEADDVLRDGELWWVTEIVTFMLTIRGGVCVDAPKFARKWAVGQPLEALMPRAVQQRATLYWQPPMFQQDVKGTG